jgi:hypothetical protein
MKPMIHSESSAKRFGGTPACYLKLHDWFDQTKAHFPNNAHRALLHSSFGIFLAEQVFGHVIVNSEGRNVSVRDLGEQHVLEDLGCIPTVSDYLMYLEYQPWMHGEGKPPSAQQREKPKTIIPEISKLVDGSTKIWDHTINPSIIDDDPFKLPKFPKSPFGNPEILD